MPITKRAIKKLHHDRVRAAKTEKVTRDLRKLIKSMRVSPNQKTLTHVFSAIDKAAKTRSLHKNKAARLKSRLAKLLAKK